MKIFYFNFIIDININLFNKKLIKLLNVYLL
jgi:hypothetical protein